MDIVYFKNKLIPSETFVRFMLWDLVNLKKYYLTADGGNVFVPECGIIPHECDFRLCVGKKEFEDAVLALAAEIIMDR